MFRTKNIVLASDDDCVPIVNGSMHAFVSFVIIFVFVNLLLEYLFKGGNKNTIRKKCK